MSALTNLTEDQLFVLVDQCHNLKKLQDTFGDKAASNLLNEMKDCYQVNLSERNHTSRSMLTAIAAASLPVDIFWPLVSFVNLGVAAFWLAGLFSLVTLGLGIGYFFYSYQKYSKKSQELNHFFQLSTLKLRAADILIASNNTMLPFSNENNSLAEEKTALSKTSSVMTGLTVSSILFGTFYWGVSDILLTLKLAAVATALSGTVGLTIALLAAVGIGIYLGYKHYQASQQAQEIKCQQENMQQQLAEKSRHCSTLLTMKKLHRYEPQTEFNLGRRFDTDDTSKESSLTRHQGFFSRNHVDSDENWAGIDDENLELRQNFRML